MSAGHDHPHAGPANGSDESWDAATRYYSHACNVLRDMLIERRVLSAAEIRRQIEAMESKGPYLGARLVARAWVDDGFRKRLLIDGKSAALELGIVVGEAQLIVVENTPQQHNVICCTLCSCYPRSILGQPPAWYRNVDYRSRVVREPRAVLAEFGLHVPPETAVHVHDSNADLRFLVLPMRPPGSEHCDEAALARLVTRDSLIGVASALDPS